MLLLFMKIFSIPSFCRLKSFPLSKDLVISKSPGKSPLMRNPIQENYFNPLYLYDSDSLFSYLHFVNLKEIIDIQYYLWTHNADGGFSGLTDDEVSRQYLFSVTTTSNYILFYRLRKYRYHLNDTHDPMVRCC